MTKTSTDGSYRSVVNSQEPGVVKEEITYQSALREEGIDEVFVARKLQDLLRAQGRRWNPKTKTWEKFEDHGTQLAALREVAKIFGIYPKQEDKDAEGVTIIDISAIPRHRESVLPTTNDERDGRG